MSKLLHLCLLDVKRTKPKHEARVAMRELNDLIKEWPKAKDPEYPVEGDSYKFYQDRRNGILWEDHDRLELLDWLIEKTKDHGTRTPAQKMLIAALENIDTSKGTDSICRQVRAYIAPKGHYNPTAMEAIEIMEKLMLLWPEASNDKLYPVPNPRRPLKSSPYRTFSYHCGSGSTAKSAKNWWRGCSNN